MVALVGSILALLLSTAVLMVGSGLLGTLLSVRMTVEAFDTGTTGLVLGAYFLGLALGAIWAGQVIRRAGHVRAFAVFAALVTAATLLHALRIDAWTWGVLRALAGFSLAGLYMVIESWLNERGQGAARGRLFSLYQIASYLGLGAGQFMLSLRPVEGPELFMINAVLFALCLIPVAVTRSFHPAPPERHRLEIRTVLTRSPVGATVCVGAGIINGTTFALAPVFVVAHAGIAKVPAFMGAMVLGGMLLQYPIGHLSDIFNRQKLIAAVNAALIVVIALVWWMADKGFLALAATGVAYGGLTFTLYPLAVAQVSDRAQGVSFVGIAAALLMLWGLGAAVGPVAVGRLMDLVGADGLLLANGAVAALLGLTALGLRGTPLTAEEQTAFVSMARTSSVIAAMDPRAEKALDPQYDWIDEMARADAERAAQPDSVASAEATPEPAE